MPADQLACTCANVCDFYAWPVNNLNCVNKSLNLFCKMNKTIYVLCSWISTGAHSIKLSLACRFVFLVFLNECRLPLDYC